MKKEKETKKEKEQAAADLSGGGEARPEEPPRDSAQQQPSLPGNGVVFFSNFCLKEEQLASRKGQAGAGTALPLLLHPPAPP